jgi:AcrR family transcriptional regulator
LINSNGYTDTAKRLLDAAERLFGKHGYDSVGMRALAQEARVNLAATTYHFGSKQALYQEALLRRFRALNAERLELLSAALKARGPGRATLPVEVIVECLMRPPFRIGRTNPAFSALLARTLAAPPAFLHGVAARELRPNVARFVTELRRALPQVSRAALELRVALSMGLLMMLTARMGSAGVRRSAAADERLLRELVGFAARGLASAAAAGLRRSDYPRIPRALARTRRVASRQSL